MFASFLGPTLSRRPASNRIIPGLRALSPEFVCHGVVGGDRQTEILPGRDGDNVVDPILSRLFLITDNITRLTTLVAAVAQI
jgi:hypothetical protein